MTDGTPAQGCRVEVAQTGESFLCGRDAYVLDAGLEAGLRLPHSCRGGACGTCKSEVLEGEVDHGWVQSFAITEEEKAAGLCLICQSKPLSAVLRLRPLEPMQARGAQGCEVVPLDFRAEVVASHALTPSIRELVLAVPRGLAFRYQAGQHCELAVPGVAPNRTYSLAAAPGEDGTPADGLLRFYVTRHPGGRASGWLHAHAAVGRSLDVAGPYGTFAWSAEPATTEMLLLAGGSGLAPVLALAEQALAEGEARPLRLFLSVRSAAEVFALDRLHALARRHDNFAWTVTLTREAPPAGSAWRHGRLDALLPSLAPAAGFAQAWAAGPPGFVDAAAAALAALGLPAANFKADSFLAAPSVA